MTSAKMSRCRASGSHCLAGGECYGSRSSGPTCECVVLLSSHFSTLQATGQYRKLCCDSSQTAFCWQDELRCTLESVEEMPRCQYIDAIDTTNYSREIAIHFELRY